jgi:hypothetical protein
MQFIEGKNRTQSILFPESLDQIISSDNEVRIIDLFLALAGVPKSIVAVDFYDKNKSVLGYFFHI